MNDGTIYGVFIGRDKQGLYGQYTTFTAACTGAGEYATAYPAAHVAIYRYGAIPFLVCTVQNGAQGICEEV